MKERMDFTDNFSHNDIRRALQIFAKMHAKKIQGFFVNNEFELMLDLLQVSEYDIFLPVLVRSNNWLRDTNMPWVKRSFETCLHDESWPIQQRIELVGGLEDVYEGNLIYPIKECLDQSVKYWKELKLPVLIAISERVKNLGIDTSMELLNLVVKTIKLSTEYKKQKLYFN